MEMKILKDLDLVPCQFVQISPLIKKGKVFDKMLKRLLDRLVEGQRMQEEHNRKMQEQNRHMQQEVQQMQ